MLKCSPENIWFIQLFEYVNIILFAVTDYYSMHRLKKLLVHEQLDELLSNTCIKLRKNYKSVCIVCVYVAMNSLPKKIFEKKKNIIFSPGPM